MINNRQAGRRRGRGGQQQRSQGGNPGRPDNGNRIDNRARGNAAQLLEKYKALARDAQMQGDRVNVEYYLQFADHYFRVLAETRSRFEENGGQPQGRRPQGATLDDDDQDDEDEGERGLPDARGDGGYRAPEARQDGRGQDGRGQDGRGQDSRGQDGSDGQRGGNPQYAGGQRDERGPREDRAPREDRGGYRMNGNGTGERDGQQARAPRDDRDERPRPPRADPMPELRYEQQPQVPAAPPVDRDDAVPMVAEPAVAEAPRRGRGRPRREVPAEPAAVLDAAVLPPSLGVSAVVASDDADGPAGEKPRRRRGRPPATVSAVD